MMMGWTHSFQLSRRIVRRPAITTGSTSRQALLRAIGTQDPLISFGAIHNVGRRSLSLASSSAPPFLPISDNPSRRRDGVRLFSAVSNPRTSISTLDEETLMDDITNDDLVSIGGTTELQQSDKSKLEGLDDYEHLLDGLKSRPKGNWNVKDPLGWAKDFGRRSTEAEERLQKLIRLKEGDEGYFKIDPNEKMEGVTIVRNKEQAKIVLEKLNQADPSTFHACDTEVMDIDVKSEGPVGNGYVTCISVYSGPDFDYGLGDGPGSVLWIDNLDDACGILQEFKEWFENENHLKVWHNYGFDRHVMWNEGIDVRGFGGDTMHMARLQDTSRSRSIGSNGNGYGLEALSVELLKDEDGALKTSMKELFGVPRLRKDGTAGAILDIPPVEVLQRDPTHRERWIHYSCRDAKSTWEIRHVLQEKLKKEPWTEANDGNKNLYDYYFMHMRPFGEVLTDMERRGIRVDASEYLAGVEVEARKDRARHLDTFRKWAETHLGADGLALNPASAVQLQTFLFGGSTNPKTRTTTEPFRVFKVPREEIPAEAIAAYQLRDEKQKGSAEPESDVLDAMTAVQLKGILKGLGLKVSGKKADLKERIEEHFGHSGNNLNSYLNGKDDVKDDGYDAMTEKDLRDCLVGRGLSKKGNRDELLKRLREDIKLQNELKREAPPTDREDYMTLSDALEAASKVPGSSIGDILAEVRNKKEAVPKHIEVTIRSVGLEPIKYTTGGAPSVTADVLKTLAGDPFSDPPKYGTAYQCFNDQKSGREACIALFSLHKMGSIDTMIANFLTSLQCLADDKSRVHCSLNLNTDTGRLSSRRPNLQNQPALEKDVYKIRQAFQSSPGHNLIVADYGQLELRLLASMAGCKSMIDAFEAGGDFHSRTAIDMFDYVKAKVDAGECLLEWDYANGDPPKPLVKDEFASERRKAKTLNFSIAYGKTAHGLSQDWGVSVKEAEEMLQAWYNARPEIREWQANKKETAKKFGYTTTLMGRKRQLPEAMGQNRKLQGHAERASINTPIQGGAADVAMMAMNKINESELLKRLGWILLLQIHDEVILEGPEETAEEAFTEVLRCMEAPWVEGLPPTAVPLLVDGSYEHKNWYEAK